MLKVIIQCNYFLFSPFHHISFHETDEFPVLGDGTVTWSLPETQSRRFYYKCHMDKEQIVLPWDFDVSYKLNGMPIDADKLAGASGNVEIHVDAEPNDNALEYYRNNMILVVAVTLDYDDCYSVEVEGAQTQNLGDMTSIAFTALPGEEGDYTVRIGSDSFENIGVVMIMTPGTVEDLEHISGLKEAKEVPCVRSAPAGIPGVTFFLQINNQIELVNTCPDYQASLLSYSRSTK